MLASNMHNLQHFKDFLIASFLLIAVLPIMKNAITIIAPNMGQTETLFLTAIPTIMVLKVYLMLMPLSRSKGSGNKGR